MINLCLSTLIINKITTPEDQNCYGINLGTASLYILTINDLLKVPMFFEPMQCMRDY